MKRTIKLIVGACLGTVLFPAWIWAATPTAVQALKLTPVQRDVCYDQPNAETAEKCAIAAKKIDGRIGWIVTTREGVILRKFLDTNGDNVVDQWCYYKDGLEVYRDIDSNYNGKVDQYRWFNTGGTRWGIDRNEDGVIDYWKSISAEEAAAEAVAALAARDAERFARLLPTPTELKSLGLGPTRADSLAEKIKKAMTEFQAVAARQNMLGADTEWIQLSAGRPGLVPAEAGQTAKDILVYENASAIAISGGKHVQVQLGTLIQTGENLWRLVDLPQIVAEGQAQTPPTGFFFQASMSVRGQPSGGMNEGMQKLLADLEELDRQAAEAKSVEERTQFTHRRADLLERLAAACQTAEERSLWLRQLADMLGAAVHSGDCPDGSERLQALFDKLNKNDADRQLAAYVKFRQLTADYFLAMQKPKADFAKLQEEWLKTLEKFIADFPTAPDAAEAMLQLGISEEFTGQEADAKNWYTRLVKEFPDSPAAKKAAGALVRLDSIGKPLSLSGRSPLGSTVDLAAYRGKVVLIHYWATWSAPSKADMPALKELWNKYGRGFTIIGINLDQDVNTLNAYLAENPLPWPQIYEAGGLDSPPANALGIITVPTMILVDQQGKVISRGLTAADLEAELKKLVR